MIGTNATGVICSLEEAMTEANSLVKKLEEVNRRVCKHLFNVEQLTEEIVRTLPPAKLKLLVELFAPSINILNFKLDIEKERSILIDQVVEELELDAVDDELDTDEDDEEYDDNDDDDAAVPHHVGFEIGTLTEIQRLISASWMENAREDKKAAKEYLACRHYMEASELVKPTKGIFRCLICNRKSTSTGRFITEDGRYSFCEDYMHYVIHHGVKPPKEFIKSAMFVTL
jgi:hypothetical protein